MLFGTRGSNASVKFGGNQSSVGYTSRHLNFLSLLDRGNFCGTTKAIKLIFQNKKILFSELQSWKTLNYVSFKYFRKFGALIVHV